MEDEEDDVDEEDEEAEEDEEERKERAPRRSRRLYTLVAIVVAVVVVAAVVGYLLTQNRPPTAAFSYESSDLHLSVSGANSTDPDGDALNFSWSWGDNAAKGYGLTASHDYAAQGTVTVTLTVSDGRGGVSTAPQQVTLRVLPRPLFVARQTGMTTTFDATAAQGSPGHAITSYAWAFGDGASGTGVRTTHTYAAPGRYTASLTVTDDASLASTASRYVSANTTTVDVLGSQFFTAGCPYQQYWSLRYKTYGDIILNRTVPSCTDYYPWILWNTALRTETPSWTYTLWRLDMLATNNLGYSVANPVYLPVFNASVAPAPDSYIEMNLTLNYLNKNNINLTDPLNIVYWDTTPWRISTTYSDGYGNLVQGTITMDLTESRRIFGVNATTPAAAQRWWYNNTVFGGAPGPLETRMSAWLNVLGNGKYNTYNAFQWQYQTDITDLNATVASDGTTTVRVFWDGWGYDVMFDRMSYWGDTNYSQAVNAPWGQYQPRGWMPFETCWCENATINATIRNSLDMHYAGTSEYWFSAVGNAGRDGILNTSDDLPGWSWAPILMDYVPRAGSGLTGALVGPNSELRWYESDLTMITSPGSWGYGTRYEYMVTPDRWNMSLGNTVTLILPSFRMPWFDPVKSAWNPSKLIGDYVTFLSNLTLRLVTPSAGGYWLWDARAKVFSLAAPAGFRWSDTGAPLASEPYIEFGPETTH